VSADVVMKDMADGRIFMGQQAIDAGLVDGVSTLDALVQQLNDSRASGTPLASLRTQAKPAKPGAGAALENATPTFEGSNMPITRDQIAAESPDLLAALQAEGATAERQRIQAVEGQLIPGHEALINSMKFDGKSNAGDAAVAVLAAEKATRTSMAANLAADAPKPLPAAAPPAEKRAMTRADVDAAAKQLVAATPGMDYVAAVKQVQAQNALA
jgi:capsid assembly protease